MCAAAATSAAVRPAALRAAPLLAGRRCCGLFLPVGASFGVYSSAFAAVFLFLTCFCCFLFFCRGEIKNLDCQLLDSQPLVLLFLARASFLLGWNGARAERGPLYIVSLYYTPYFPFKSPGLGLPSPSPTSPLSPPSPPIHAFAPARKNVYNYKLTTGSSIASSKNKEEKEEKTKRRKNGTKKEERLRRQARVKRFVHRLFSLFSIFRT